MAFSKVPTELFTGYEKVAASGTATAESVVIPLTALPSLTAAEANATTGDSREIVRSIVESAYQSLEAMGEDKPTKMSISKTEYPVAGLINSRVIAYNLSFTVETSANSFNMSAE